MQIVGFETIVFEVLSKELMIISYDLWAYIDEIEVLVAQSNTYLVRISLHRTLDFGETSMAEEKTKT